jgi:hypothetical protein
MAQKKYQKQRDHTRNNLFIPALLGLGGLALLVIAFLALRGGGQKAAVEVTGSPSLKVDKEEINFGEVKLGQTVEASFTVTNAGGETLRFSEQPYIEVKQGC